MKIIRNVFLFTLLLMPVCSNAMWDETDIVMVALAMNVGTRDVRKLARIDLGEIESITRFQNDKVETYRAELPGGDMLFANLHFDGQISCTRDIAHCCTTGGYNFVVLPLSSNYFFMLKDLYEKSQQEKANENK